MDQAEYIDEEFEGVDFEPPLDVEVFIARTRDPFKQIARAREVTAFFIINGYTDDEIVFRHRLTSHDFLERPDRQISSLTKVFYSCIVPKLIDRRVKDRFFENHKARARTPEEKRSVFMELLQKNKELKKRLK